MFISFEGIDFSGKSTQCHLLEKFLTEKGYDVVLLREPGGTRISEIIRKLLLDKRAGDMSALTELLLYSASRAQLVDEVIRPAIVSGRAVICDRFTDSSTAYQGFGRGLEIKEIEMINKVATNGLEPDLTIFIDVTVEESLKRLKLAGKLKDRIESEGTRFFELVRQGYLQLATRHKDRFKVVDGMDDIDNIKRRVKEIVVKRFTIK
ncbi:MAG: dTMP kinase [candidate division Zixibacteria bacterium 4484_95]|nr:MAG: dTMP kinase [candidate division Zixibacteria bacterium 4484_95]RKX21088.1 MAG: dTMP kinase [candidate division Zixibacteria bacterium]